MDILNGIFWIFLTVYHEAKGEMSEGQKNVVKVILNRAEKRSYPLENIVLARKQFSCFNLGLDDPSVQIRDIKASSKVMLNVLAGISEWQNGNRLSGATHYYAPKRMKNRKPPYWIVGMEFIEEIGGHRFYKED